MCIRLTRKAPPPRPVPQQMAPDRCVTTQECVSCDMVALIGRDLQGVVRVRVELSREDACDWWVRVLRHWLAWKHGACEVRLIS
jgi:hypothetical protein